MCCLRGYSLSLFHCIHSGQSVLHGDSDRHIAAPSGRQRRPEPKGLFGWGRTPWQIHGREGRRIANNSLGIQNMKEEEEKSQEMERSKSHVQPQSGEQQRSSWKPQSVYHNILSNPVQRHKETEWQTCQHHRPFILAART